MYQMILYDKRLILHLTLIEQNYFSIALTYFYLYDRFHDETEILPIKALSLLDSHAYKCANAFGCAYLYGSFCR